MVLAATDRTEGFDAFLREVEVDIFRCTFNEELSRLVNEELSRFS